MTEGPPATATAALRSAAARISTTGPALQALGSDRVASAIARAAAALSRSGSEVAEDARRALGESTGLSDEMVRWALETTLGPADEPALRALAEHLRAPLPWAVVARARLAVLVLAGNVFTAPFRAICLPLLSGVPVVAKASSRDDVFPRLLSAALRAVDAEVGRSFEVFTFPRGSTALLDALVSQADVVSAYGSDATLAELRGRLSATTTFVSHGHGVGVAYVPEAALQRDPGETAARIALDVAAYDQRGCLSPHAVFVDGGATRRARDFAAALSEALGGLASRLPRGVLPVEMGAAQLQWRGVAAVRGELFEGDGWAVSFEGEGPLRLSPGYRNVSVLACDAAQLGRRLLPLGAHLKALGVAGDEHARRALAERLPAPLCPRVSDVGAMQSPPLDSLADGADPFTGLVRWTQVD